MTISEQSRHAMYVQLESVLGQEAALILMEHLPPVGWADVATKRDLDQLHTLMQRDLALGMAQLRGDLRGEIGQLGTGLRSEMSQLGTDFRREMGELRGEMFDRMTAQTRTLVFTVLGSLATMAAVTLSAARFG